MYLNNNKDNGYHLSFNFILLGFVLLESSDKLLSGLVG